MNACKGFINSEPLHPGRCVEFKPQFQRVLVIDEFVFSVTDERRHVSDIHLHYIRQSCSCHVWIQAVL